MPTPQKKSAKDGAHLGRRPQVLVSPVPLADASDHGHITNKSFNEHHAAYVRRAEIFRRRIAATPRPPQGSSVDESRRRRGRVEKETGRYDAATHNQSLLACDELGRGQDGPDWPRGGLLKQARRVVSDLAKRLVAADAKRRAGAGAAPPPRDAGDDVGAAPAAGARHFFALPNSYELYGVDVMVDSEKRVVLLECNPEPSMGMWHRTKQDVLRGKCPVVDGVARTDETSTGFTKAYSKRFEAALRMARAERAARAAAAADAADAPPPPPRADSG